MMGVFPKRRQAYYNSSNGILSIAFFLLTITVSFWAFNESSVEATKHSFITKSDTRLFIGPIGSPFGFLRDGSYTLSVFDYQLKVDEKKSRKKGGSKNNNAEKEKEIWQVQEDSGKEKDIQTFEAAFVLARFRSESQFERYKESLMETMLQTCSFQVPQTDSDGYIFPVANDVFQREHNSIVLKMTSNTPTKTTIKAQKKNSSISSIQHTFSQSAEEGLYILFYQVCLFPPISNATNTASSEALKILQKYTISSTFELDIALSNMYKGKVSFLTAGELPLPKMFFLFGLVYAVLIIIWFRLLKSKKITFYIHYLMALLLLLKLATLISDSARYHYIRIYGHTLFWSAVYNLFLTLKGIMLFTTILLIGSGWSFVKPFLNERERKIILLVLILQILDNVVLVLVQLETEGERLYEDWNGLLHFIDILCCCAALLPIIWQVSILEKNAAEDAHHARDSDDDESIELHDDANTDKGLVEEKEQHNAHDRPATALQFILSQDQQKAIIKLRLFRQFYIILVTYIYITRVVVFLVAGWLGFRYSWVSTFLNEASTLVFYVSTGYIFQPRDDFIYEGLKNDDIDDEDYVREKQIEEEEDFVNGRGVVSHVQQHRSVVELT